MTIILVVHKKDGDKYIQHMSTFKKAFPNFLYMSLDSSELSSPVNEANATKGNGATQEQHEVQ
jgi:hypothetical protein